MYAYIHTYVCTYVYAITYLHTYFIVKNNQRGGGERGRLTAREGEKEKNINKNQQPNMRDWTE